jgi:hypothetical protein
MQLKKILKREIKTKNNAIFSVGSWHNYVFSCA